MASGERLCTIDAPWYDLDNPTRTSSLKEQVAQQTSIPVVDLSLFLDDGTELKNQYLHEVFGRDDMQYSIKLVRHNQQTQQTQEIVLLPLDRRIGRDERYTSMLSTLRQELSSLGMSYTIDESSATIGRRYARNDELGVPFALTLDFQTLEDKTATLRVRDAMDQLRCPLDGLPSLIRDLCAGEITWDAIMAKYPHR